jgi:endonuclease YncB( thermonuclease family)
MTSAQTHPAKIVSVHDGDTIKVSIPLARSRAKDRDLGFHIYVEHGWLVLHAPIRLLGCNAIELHSPGGVEARDNLAALLPVGTTVMLMTVAVDKYGSRWWDSPVLRCPGDCWRRAAGRVHIRRRYHCRHLDPQGLTR